MSTHAICPCPNCSPKDHGGSGCIGFLVLYFVSCALVLFLLMCLFLGPEEAYRGLFGSGPKPVTIEHRLDRIERELGIAREEDGK